MTTNIETAASDRILYHHPLSPSAREARLVLNEKKLAYKLILEKPWERRREYLAVNPTGDVPTLHEPDGSMLSDIRSLTEYLEERYPETPLLCTDYLERAEIRRLVSWFSHKLYQETTSYILEEKVIKSLARSGAPNSNAIRAGKKNLEHHLAYLSYLAEQRHWLAGDLFSLADIAAAAQLSVLDYLSEVPWHNYPEAKIWYARVKSRPSFRSLLEDSLPTIKPAPHYRDLDF